MVTDDDITEHLPNRPITDDELQEMRAVTGPWSIYPVHSGLVNASALGSRRIHGFLLVNEPDWMYEVRLDAETESWVASEIDVDTSGDCTVSWSDAIPSAFFNLRSKLEPDPDTDTS